MSVSPFKIIVNIPAPAIGETLDAVDALEELVEAQNESYMLGLKLRLPKYVVQAIHDKYTNPRDRLLHVLLEFNEQTDPRPTWGVIIDALRSPAINMKKLAEKVESRHGHIVSTGTLWYVIHLFFYPSLCSLQCFNTSLQRRKKPTLDSARNNQHTAAFARSLW